MNYYVASAVKNTHFQAKRSRCCACQVKNKICNFQELEIGLHSQFSVWWNNINVLDLELVTGENNWMRELHCVLSGSMIWVQNFLQSECCPFLEGEPTTQQLKTLTSTVRRWFLSFCGTLNVVLCQKVCIESDHL